MVPLAGAEMVSQSHHGPQRGVQTAVHHLCSPYRAASNYAIARWIVQAIKSGLSSKLAYALGEPGPCSLGPGNGFIMGFFKGVPIEDIIKAACWKSPRTFTSCYLKDVPQQEGGAGRTALMAAKAPSSRGDVSSQKK